MLLAIFVLAISQRTYLAFNHVGRVWIDEVWVVLNPAYWLVSGAGFMNPVDWFSPGIRSWLPPLLVAGYFRFCHFLGIDQPWFVFSFLSLIVSFINFAATSYLILVISGLRNWAYSSTVFALIAALFAPEVVRHSLSVDLSVMAWPFLSIGIAHLSRALVAWQYNPRADWLPYLLTKGLVLVVLAALIRYQLLIVPCFILLTFMLAGHWRYFLLTTAVIFFGLLSDGLLNTLFYGYWKLPIFVYYWSNTAGGMAASYGVSPWYHGVEILWRFCTEPTFALALFAMAAIFKTNRVSKARLFDRSLFSFDHFILGLLACLTLSHLVVGHKEFRFFYTQSILMGLASGMGFEMVRSMLHKVISNQNRHWAFAAILVLVFFQVWRGAYKVDWATFDMPANMVYQASTQKDLDGLLVFGWGGIKNPSQSGFYSAKPFWYFESSDQIKNAKLDFNEIKRISHVLAPSHEPAPCGALVKELQDARLYRCRTKEIMVLSGNLHKAEDI